jgi:cytochrome d ubiquinol oxidase subunit II
MSGDFLTLIWFAIIAFGVFMYVLLDGFVLGIGVLFTAIHGEDDRDVMMQSVAPIWDGNETWLVLGGAGLFAAFPLAYAVILPALYLPLSAMLLALVFRGVAFELRFKATTHRHRWSVAFYAGSIIATFAQGATLGALVQGITVVDRQFAGGAFDWLSPFSLFSGISVVAGYALLGATWLVMKTEGPLQQRANAAAHKLNVAVLIALAIISAWVPFLSAHIRDRWFSWPNIALLSPAPVFTAVAGFLLWRSLRAHQTFPPFILAMALFFLGYSGLAISIWPNIVPPSITIWAAASPPESQLFLLVGVLFLLPIIIGYTAYSYWIFRGKVGSGAGYH